MLTLLNKDLLQLSGSGAIVNPPGCGLMLRSGAAGLYRMVRQ